MNLKNERITREDFMALSEYSATIPTGTTIGKRWRRHDGIFDHDFIAAGGKPRWMIGEYIDIGSDTEVGIEWKNPVFVKKEWLDAPAPSDEDAA